MQDAPVIACRLTTPELASRLAEVRSGLVANARQIEPVANGICLTLDGDDAQTDAVLEFIRFERQCCPFFHFAMTISPESGPIQLTVTGPPEAQDLISHLLADHSTRQETIS